MKTLYLWIVCLLAAPAVLAGEPPLAQILDANAAAIGSKDVLAGRTSMEVRLMITEPTFQVTGHYRATRDGRMRIDVFADGKRVFTGAFDGTQGWQQHGEGGDILDMTPEGEAAVRRGVIANLTVLRDRQALGYVLSTAGTTDIGGTHYYMIDSVAPDGFAERFYINSDTGLVERSREASALHPDIDGTVEHVEEISSDFRRVDGIMMPVVGRKRQLASGNQIQETRVQACHFNVEIDDGVFKRPADGTEPAQ
ncbi:MAG: hypothetical protein EP335_07220 [Alphaproteobacteria bacterium]|nr:MAG: hypothetical protein EP335_07220 [Alphaproteobacteria bacterium]